jgi:hypothetical protein
VEARGAAPDQVGHGSRLRLAPRGSHRPNAPGRTTPGDAELVARAGVPSATGGRM